MDSKLHLSEDLKSDVIYLESHQEIVTEPNL